MVLSLSPKPRSPNPPKEAKAMTEVLAAGLVVAAEGFGRVWGVGFEFPEMLVFCG